MGLFSKLKSLISNKKHHVANEIESKLQENSYVEQKKFDEGLKKSSSSLNSAINNIAKKYVQLDANLIEQIEEALLMYDIGTGSTKKILDAIVNEIKLQNVTDANLIKQIIIDKLFVYYIQDTNVDSELKLVPGQTNVILVTGVNGVGKTTSIAKLTKLFKKQNLEVCMIAADTFRAGAVAQLST
jgi:fused signal recognition particle receptor